MISRLVLVLLSGSPVAQDLANASRQLESAVATHSPTESRQAEVDALVERWVREELEVTIGLPLEVRVARYYRLLEVTSLSSSGVAALRASIERQAEPTFRAWLDQGDALLAANKPMRVLALRKQFTNAVGKRSELLSLRADLDAKALAQLQLGDEPFARFASQALEALVSARSVELPAELTRFRFLRTAPSPSSACALETLNFPVRGDGVEATLTVSMSSCEVRATDEARERSLNYEGEILVERDVQVQVGTRMESYETSYRCGDDCNSVRVNNGNGNAVLETTCSPRFCTSTRMREVPVYEMQRVKVPEMATLTESYIATTRTWTTSPSLTISLEGDGARVDDSAEVSAKYEETQFKTVHGSSASFSGAGKERALQRLREAVEARLATALETWNTRRGKALLGNTTVEPLVKAAVLMNALPSQLTSLLTARTGVTAQEAGILVPPHRASLELPGFPSAATASLSLPPPDADLNQRLATFERKVELVEDRKGTFAGVQLGVLAAESTDELHELRFGFGGAVVTGWRPLFSVKSPFLLRVIGNFQAGTAGFFQFDAAGRVEVGVEFFPVQVALIGVAQLAGTIQLEETELTRRYFSPIVFSGGYGARLQVSFARFVMTEDSESATTTLGLEVVAARMHRTFAAAPIGTRVEAQLFFDLASIVKFTLGLKVNSNADVLQLFSSPTRLALFSLGLQADF